jgi:hypothetical protein
MVILVDKGTAVNLPGHAQYAETSMNYVVYASAVLILPTN